MKTTLCPLLVVLPCSSPLVAAEESVDASDPTEIHTYAGAGIKHAHYTNGESMAELRATGNVGLSEPYTLLEIHQPGRS